jgi:hypothetical protein
MEEAEKYTSLDVNVLRQSIAFDYLQLFELSPYHGSTRVTEYSVPPQVEVPRDTRFAVVSARATMRADLKAGPSVTVLPKQELLRDWDFNIVAVIIQPAEAPVLLLFYSRSLPTSTPDLVKLAAAIRRRSS